VAVLTFMKVVLRVLEKQLELDHEDSRNKFVLPLLGLIELLDRDPASQFANERRVDAARVYLQLDDFVEILYEELNRVLYYWLEAEELC
jgi:hypothetical protein